jgi:hypothetical protein
LYYWNDQGQLMAAAVTTVPTFAVASRREVPAPAPAAASTDIDYDIARDGRVLMAHQAASSYQLVMVRNWFAELERQTKK